MTRIASNTSPSTYLQSPAQSIATGRKPEQDDSSVARDTPDSQGQQSYKAQVVRSESIRDEVFATTERRAKSAESIKSDVKQAIATTNAARGPGEALTPAEIADFTRIYDMLQTKEGRSHVEATEFAADMLKPLNTELLKEFNNKLPEIEKELNKVDGKNLGEIVTDIQIDQMESFGGYLGQLMGLAKSEGNAYGEMVLQGMQGIVKLATETAGAEPGMKNAVAIRELAATSGKSFSQLMNSMGEGDLAVLGALATDLGKSYAASVDPNSSNIQEAAIHLRGFGNTTLQLGISQNNIEMQATARIMMASADFIAGVEKKNTVDQNPDSRSSLPGQTVGGSVAGDGIAFTGNLTQAIGLLSGDEKLIGIGKNITSASSLLGEDNIAPQIFRGEVSLTDGINFATVSANIAGDLVGGQKGETIKNVSDMLNTGYSLYNQVSNAIENGTNIATDPQIASLTYKGLVQVLNFAGIEIPPEVNNLIQSAIAGLSSDSLQGGPEALIETLSPLVVELIKSVDPDSTITEAVVNEALGAAKDIGGAAAIVYKVVRLGLDIADIASRGDINDTTKAQLSLDAVSSLLLTTGLANVVNPLGWGLIVLSGVTSHISAAIGVAEDGFNRDNLIKIFGGALGTALFPPKPPRTTLATFDRENLPTEFLEIISNTEPDEDGVLVLTANSNRSAFATIESPLGYTLINMARMERGLTGEAREERVSAVKPMLAQVLETDRGLVKALNDADINNGENGMSMRSYSTNLANNTVKDREKLDGADYLDMMDKRYKIIVGNMAASGSKAGQALKTWMDAIDRKVIDVSGDTYSVIQAFAKNPKLLEMPPEIIERILSTVKPGSLKHVIDQLDTVVGTYLDVLTNPLVQSNTPMNQFEALDFTISYLKLSESYAETRAPEVSTAPGLDEVVTALDDIPQEVKDTAYLMNGAGSRVLLLGLSETRGSYRLSINGQVDDYRYVDGDEPFFEKVIDETPYIIDSEKELLTRLTHLNEIDVYGNIPEEYGIDKQKLARGLDYALRIAKNPNLSIVTDPEQQPGMDAMREDVDYAMNALSLVEFQPGTGIDNSKMAILANSIKENIFYVLDDTPYQIDNKPELLRRLKDFTQIDVFGYIPKEFNIDEKRLSQGLRQALNLAASGTRVHADTTDAEYALAAVLRSNLPDLPGPAGFTKLMMENLINDIKSEIFY